MPTEAIIFPLFYSPPPPPPPPVVCPVNVCYGREHDAAAAHAQILSDTLVGWACLKGGEKRKRAIAEVPPLAFTVWIFTSRRRYRRREKREDQSPGTRHPFL